MIDEVIGKCAQCRGLLILASDEQGRKWTVCAQCGAQYPLEQGHLIIGSLPDKVAEKGLPQSPNGLFTFSS